MYDLLVVGAGPAGSRTAALMAAAGHSVALLEEHAAAGEPVHCTGIVGEDCMQRYALPPALVRKLLPHFEVIAPDGTVCPLPGSVYVLDRAGLDRLLAERARHAGAELHTGCRALQVQERADRVSVEVRRADGVEWLEARHVVLACGAMSTLPRRSGLAEPEAWYRSVQSEWETPPPTTARVLLGSAFSQGAFAWTVPLGPTSIKMGLLSPTSVRQGYHRLTDGLPGRPLGRAEWRRMPMGLVSRSVRGRVAAVGDAAGQVKTTTGGGIYYALRCADLLAQALLAGRLDRYEPSWRELVGRDLHSGRLARRLLERLDDAEMNRLVRLCRRDEVQGLLANHWHFDFHQGILRALATAPGLRRLAAETCTTHGFQHLLKVTDRLRLVPGLRR
ncbi:MAG TPA: NAD(P)/FAD-dependent oxidoreductase [Candidatus Xenobia bacterium]|jgi:geranylgeranyl reductase family protein